jgi:FG-GAP-like repeat
MPQAPRRAHALPRRALPRRAAPYAIAALWALHAVALVEPVRAAPIGPDNYDFATFQPAVQSHDPAHFGGWTQVLADHDGDGRLDRLVHALDAMGWRTWVSLGRSDGGFGPSLPWQTAGSWLGWTLAMADVDGDSAADIVLHANDGAGWRSFVALSLRDGTFAPPASWSRAGDWSGWTPLLADVTGDRKVDLLLARADAAGWQIALAAGAGTGDFAAPAAWSSPGAYTGWRIGTGDFNGDGRADLSLDDHDGASWRARVALATAGGSFAAPIAWLAPGDRAGWTPGRGDFDGDGRTDLLLWAIDAGGWRADVARADGAGAFTTPVSWTAAAPGAGWTLSIADVNADRGADLILQRADAAGWQARVAVASGGGSFFAPRPWGALAQHFGGWTTAVGDVSGDGRADLLVYAVDAAGWRSHVATATGCQHVFGTRDDLGARIAALPHAAQRRMVCLRPGLYTRELLIADRENLSIVAAHGGVTIATSSYAFAPWATVGKDPGAPVQIVRSRGVELDGLELRNLFTYRAVVGPDGELDQTYMVSRAIEILDSAAIRIANSRLVGPGKQLVHTSAARDTLIEGSQLECYYFCIDARYSTLEVRRSAFRAEHAEPGDTHALLWTDHSSQTYRHCTMDMVTGKSLFAGVNDFATDVLVITGHTEVTAGAEAWMSQHPNYDGLNLELRGDYPALLDWYFIDWMGSGTQQQSRICHAPDAGPAYCVSPDP